MSDKPQMIRPRNTMLERLGGRPGVPGKVDASLLKKAEDRIAEVGATYPDRVKSDLEKLVALAGQAASDADRRAEAITSINLIVHEIRGEGATFGYPLLTKFAGSLFKFTDGLTSPTERQLALIKAHVDAYDPGGEGRHQGRRRGDRRRSRPDAGDRDREIRRTPQALKTKRAPEGARDCPGSAKKAQAAAVAALAFAMRRFSFWASSGSFAVRVDSR